MLVPIAFLLALNSVPTADPEGWLAGLELASVPWIHNDANIMIHNDANIMILNDANIIRYSSEVGIMYFDLGFPEDAQEKVDDANERLEAADGSSVARLIHQAAEGFTGLGEKEKATDAWRAALMAYELEVEESPDDFDLRMSFGTALATIGLQNPQQEVWFEAFERQLLAAAKLEPRDARPGALGALVWVQRILKAAQTDEEVEDDWNQLGLQWAEAARDADPTAVGGHWWCFVLGLRAVGALESDSSLRKALLVVEEMLDGCEQLKDPCLMQLIGHMTHVGLECSFPREGQAYRESLADHMQGVMDRIECCEGIPGLRRSVGYLFWQVTCKFCAEDEDLSSALEQAVELGNTQEMYSAMAVSIFIQREILGLATEFAEILRGEFDTGFSLAVLIQYHYALNEFDEALKYSLEVEEDLEPGEDLAAVQCDQAIVRLRLGDREAALEALENLASAGPELGGRYYHALGVARALSGDYERAVDALEVAIDSLDESEAAEATLEDVRGMIKGGDEMDFCVAGAHRRLS